MSHYRPDFAKFPRSLSGCLWLWSVSVWCAVMCGQSFINLFVWASFKSSACIFRVVGKPQHAPLWALIPAHIQAEHRRFLIKVTFCSAAGINAGRSFLMSNDPGFHLVLTVLPHKEMQWLFVHRWFETRCWFGQEDFVCVKLALVHGQRMIWMIYFTGLTGFFSLMCAGMLLQFSDFSRNGAH